MAATVASRVAAGVGPEVGLGATLPPVHAAAAAIVKPAVRARVAKAVLKFIS